MRHSDIHSGQKVNYVKGKTYRPAYVLNPALPDGEIGLMIATNGYRGSGGWDWDYELVKPRNVQPATDEVWGCLYPFSEFEQRFHRPYGEQLRIPLAAVLLALGTEIQHER